MKLCRFGSAGRERPGVVHTDGTIRSLAGLVPDLTPDSIGAAFLDRLSGLDIGRLSIVDPGVRLGPPVASTGKIVGIGLNYALHAQEAGLPTPVEPALFLKAPSALTGPFDDILMPPDSVKLDWEVELAVIIGRRATRVAPGTALEHVFGYCLFNDVSERNHQLECGGQWTKGKSADSFAPLGPYLVTPDELGDPQSVQLWLEVNGQRMQDARTADMIFPVAALISHVSRFMSLLPGDIIATGTPSGVGHGCTPATYLKAGDTVRLGGDRLGEQRLHVRQVSSNDL